MLSSNGRLHIFIILTLFSSKFFGSNLIIKETEETFSLIEVTSWHIDTTHQLDIGKIKNSPVKKIFNSTSDNSNINLGYVKHPIWFHSSFKVEKDDDWIYHLQNSYAEHLDICIIVNGVQKHIRTGNKTPFKTRGRLESIDFAY